MAVGRRLLDTVEDPPDFFLHKVPQTLAAARARADGGNDAFRRRQADIGRDEQLLERLDRIDVDWPRPLFAGVGLLNNLLEAADDLLLRPRQAFAEAV